MRVRLAGRLGFVALLCLLGSCADVIGLDEITYDAAPAATMCVPGTSVSCYSGPMSAAGVGACTLGTKTCEPNGAAFGPCAGDKAPAPEVCATHDVDEDCDGNNDCPAEHLWSKRIGASLDDTGRGLALDPAGNVILVGDIHGMTADIDGMAVPAAGSMDMLVAAFDPTGKTLWGKRLGSAIKDDEVAASVAVGPDGHPVITGYFSGTGGMVDLGGAAVPSFGNHDVFIAKLDDSGNFLWAKSFGGLGADEARSIAVDPQGNIYVAGLFSATVDFGDGAPVTSNGAEDAFVVKLAPDGSYLWSRALGSSMSQIAESITVDTSGNAFIVGSFDGSLSAGAGADLSCSTALLSEGQTDVFLAGLSPTGDCILQKRLGDSKIQEGHGVASGPGGALAFTGKFGGSLDYGASSISVQGGFDAFAARVTTNGELSWLSDLGDADSNDTFTQEGFATAIDGSGNVLLTGGFQGDLGVGGAKLVNNLPGNTDIFVIKMSLAGLPVWSRSFGANNNDEGRAVVADASGNVYVAGSFIGVVDFGGGKLDAAGASDIFLLKLRP